MALVRINRRFFHNLKTYRLFSTTTNEEYTATPEYPPILDLSIEKVRIRRKGAWDEAVKDVRTVEEKQIKLNIPKGLGYHCHIIREDNIPYSALPWIQHVTRTHFTKQNALPEFYNKINVDTLALQVQQQLEEAIYLEFSKRRFAEDRTQPIDAAEDTITTLVTRQINRIILNNLSKEFPHIVDTQVDHDVRHEAFWFSGGIHPSENLKRCKKGHSWSKRNADDPVDRPLQYLGRPAVALRHQHPLLPLVPFSESLNPSLNVPTFPYDPRVLGGNKESRHGTNIPGFWPGDHSEFGLLGVYRRGHLQNRTFGAKDKQEALDCLGIASSFAWLLAQSSFKGFTTHNDVTYPFVAQTVVTNGQLWSFYAMQLNTVAFNGVQFYENPRKNLCWGTAEQKLFEKVDENGKFTGLNEEVLKNLLKFYANAPQERLGLDLSPFLSKEEKRVADYEDDDKREWLERQYKFIMSNRPRHRLPFELYHWEKIYKVDHKTRPMDKKRRPFELGLSPWNKRLDDRKPDYIPRKLRPGGIFSRIKYRKMYYP